MNWLTIELSSAISHSVGGRGKRGRGGGSGGELTLTRTTFGTAHSFKNVRYLKVHRQYSTPLLCNPSRPNTHLHNHPASMFKLQCPGVNATARSLMCKVLSMEVVGRSYLKVRTAYPWRSFGFFS